MKVIRFSHAETCEPEPGWNRWALASSDGVSVEWFEKPPGHASPLHSHANEQVMVVVQGTFKVGGAQGEGFLLEKGDAVHFSSWEPHWVQNIGEGEAVGIDIFCPGRPFDFWKKRTG